MIEIDGSYGEGGGQIIRTALSLASITKKSVLVRNIRANRPNPGLAAQHLTAARAVRSICRGTLSHCEIGSTEFSFEPGEIVGGKYDFNIGTAGSTVLVAQTLLPLLLSASKPSVVRIIGGTHVMKSPSYDYFEKVFMPAIALFGAKAGCRLIKSGYFPKGGGEMELEAQPSRLSGNSAWLREESTSVLIRLSGLPLSIGVREKKVFVQNDIGHVRIFEEEGEPANAILAWSGFLGSYALGEKGRRAEQVAQECLDALLLEKRAGSDVDCHLADQLLIYAALSDGGSRFKTSSTTTHSETNAYVISRFLGRRMALEGGDISVE
ncbi:MAG: RNA 3'-terminal phosphate cyclase [Candidatus ainarchaeum sp.]|nr:RNA 3'-terminal phosphate cyclase [Candidatus ainarchaeum sp.]